MDLRVVDFTVCSTFYLLGQSDNFQASYRLDQKLEVSQFKFELTAFQTLTPRSWLLSETQGTSKYGGISFILDPACKDIVNKDGLPCLRGGEDMEELA